jgi:hypothetical protein
MGSILSKLLTQATDSDNVSAVSGSPEVAPSPPPASAESPSDDSAKTLAVSASTSSVTSTDLPDGADQGALATMEAATVQNLVTIVHSFAPAVSDFLKVVVAGVLAAKLNETDTFEFLMPHTEEQLRE